MGAACTVASTAACGVVYPTIWTICNGDGSEAGAEISVAWEMDMLLHLPSIWWLMACRPLPLAWGPLYGHGNSFAAVGIECS